MFTLRKSRPRFSAEPIRVTAEIADRVERLRALSAHDAELVRLLDEIERTLRPRSDAGSRPHPARSRAG